MAWLKSRFRGVGLVVRWDSSILSKCWAFYWLYWIFPTSPLFPRLMGKESETQMDHGIWTKEIRLAVHCTTRHEVRQLQGWLRGHCTTKQPLFYFQLKLYGARCACPEAFLSVTLISVTLNWTSLGMGRLLVSRDWLLPGWKPHASFVGGQYWFAKDSLGLLARCR